MQTFLPYADFRRSAAVLDIKRLGKQRVEVLQILNCLDPLYSRKGWNNHPAVKMWRSYETALILYGLVVCDAWIKKGYKDTCYEKIFLKLQTDISRSDLEISLAKRSRLFLPPWFGNEPFHSSHRSNLLRKDPVWYGQFGWAEPDDLPYVWPVS